MPWYRSPFLWIVLSQALFSAGDLLARHNLKHFGFSVAAFLTPWFLIYMVIRQIATFGQLYVFAAVELGKSAALFGAASITLSNVLGLLLLGEALTPSAYAGVALAITAFLVLALF